MHVLLEKPTGVSTQEVRLLNAEADKSGRAFGAMFNQRTNPAYRKMKRLDRIRRAGRNSADERGHHGLAARAELL